MSTWIDANGKQHVLRISGATALKLKESGVDVLSCLNNISAVESVLKAIQNPATLMATCAIIEGIEDDLLNDYFEMWDGDSFDRAAEALLESLADFFQKAPRAVFRKLLTKTVEAVRANQEKGMANALEALEKMDFSSVTSAS